MGEPAGVDRPAEQPGVGGGDGQRRRRASPVLGRLGEGEQQRVAGEVAVGELGGPVGLAGGVGVAPEDVAVEDADELAVVDGAGAGDELGERRNAPATTFRPPPKSLTLRQ